MEVRFRQSPYSVRFEWVDRGGPASSVTYVAGRWMKDGQEHALIHPSGLLGLLVPRGVKRDIHGPDMREASAHGIDEFGFLKTLDAILEVCDRASARDELELRYAGRDAHDDRASLVIERRLPYDGSSEDYPNRRLRILLDAEWLLPVACYGYADEGAQELVGSFTTTDVRLNVGLGEDDF